MAMLSGPRQRKRFHLVPRGKPLYEDETRFGTKMLEKMGWKKGQGLGANENGSKDFVRVRYKNDVCGLGFELRDDQWTEHEESFNGLLKVLNNNEDESVENRTGNDSEESLEQRVSFGVFENNAKIEATRKAEKMKEKISGISLEERSKQSKARVHYKKFTKGKDLAQYSEKDLANIFGKKAVDEQQTANDFYHQLNNIYGKNDNNFKNVQTTDTGKSIKDYSDFKIKAKKNRKRDSNTEEISLDRKLDSSEIQFEENVNEKEKDTEKNENNIVEEKTDERKMQIFNSNVSVNDYFKLKMEALRNKNFALNTTENIINNGNSCKESIEADATEIQKKTKKYIEDHENNTAIGSIGKKSKENKHILEQEKAIYNKNETMSQDKKQKKKRIDGDTMNISLGEANLRKRQCKSPTIIEVETLNETNATKKRKIECLAENTISISSDESCSDIKLAKELTTAKPPKNKTEKTNEIIETVASDKDICNDSEKKGKKKKSKRNKESIEFCINEDAILPQPSEKSSKAKRKAVSSNANSVIVSHTIELEELKKKCKSQNIAQVETSRESDIMRKKQNKNSEENTITISSDESGSETNITQELTTKKRKKNKTKEQNEMIETFSSDKDKSNGFDKQKSKRKPEKSKESIETYLNKNASLISNQAHEISNQSNATNVTSDANIQELDIKEIKEKYKAYSIYRISSFCAEKFRNINLNDFIDSTLPQIEGYGLGPDLQLDVYINEKDEERITNLWKCTLNKYNQSENPQNVYRNYVREFIKAKKTKQKIPKLYVKTWKRKNMFQAI